MSEIDMLKFFYMGSSFLILWVFIGIVLYVIGAWGLYKMGENLQIQNSWMAFIPILNLYIMGKIIGEVEIGNNKIPYIEIILPASFVASIVLGGIPLIGVLVNLAVLIIGIMAVYYLVRRYTPESAVIKTVASIILPFMFPIFLFMLRDAKPVEIIN